MRGHAGILVAALGVAGVANDALAQNTRVIGIQGCVEVAKSAARAEYKLDKDTKWLSHFRDAFCEAVHRKQTKSDKVGISIPIVDQLVASLTGSSESLDEFDRNYCRQTSLLEQFAQSTKVWYSVATPGVQAELTKCIKAALESGKQNGLSAEARPVDACHFNFLASYSRTAPPNAATATMRKPTLVNATCAAPTRPLNEAAQTIACKRTNWGPVEVTYDTSQGPIIVSLDATPVPVKPVLNPPVLDVDTKHDSISINKHALYPCTKDMKHGDRRICTGEWTLPDAAGTITNAVFPPDGCQGGDPCNYAWPKATFTDRVVKWSIDYNTEKDTQHRIDVTYTKPHVKTEAEVKALAKYEADIRQYDQMMANGPCYVPKAPPVKTNKPASSKG